MRLFICNAVSGFFLSHVFSYKIIHAVSYRVSNEAGNDLVKEIQSHGEF